MEYKYERRAPVREYLTYREFMESRKTPSRTKLEVGDIGYDYRDDLLERRIKIIDVKDDQCTYLTYQFDGIRLFESEYECYDDRPGLYHAKMIIDTEDCDLDIGEPIYVL